MTRDIDMVIDPSVDSALRLLASLDRSRYYVDDLATAEDIVLAKLEWRSQSESEQQFRDVVLILTAQTLDESYLRRWAGELGVEEALEGALRAAKS